MSDRQRRGRGERRAAVAHLAARFLTDGTAADFPAAKRKAAQRLNVKNSDDLPDNSELQQALIAQQRLFEGDRHAHRQQVLRTHALTAMQFFAGFTPRLVGPVLHGTAATDSTITLHLFHDEPEAVMRLLLDTGIRFAQHARSLRMPANESQVFPSYCFAVDGSDFEVIVFPARQLVYAPISPLDGRPMKRAGIGELRALLSDSSR